MKVKTFALAGVAGSLVAAGAATAGFTGLNLVENYVGAGWAENGYAGLTTYRLYATFDGADDGVLAVFGQPGDPAVVESTDNAFYNDAAFGGLTAPLDLSGAGIWTNQWDTYVTIAATTSVGDATGVSPGFATATNSLGTSWSDTNAGWFVTPDDAQSVGTNILIAQFTVAAGAEVSGKVNILTRANETFKGLAFPAPGALALLGLAGVAGSRRRRR